MPSAVCRCRARRAEEAAVARPVELALSDLTAATDGFAEGKLIGSGGFSDVYEASADLHLSSSPRLRSCAVDMLDTWLSPGLTA